MPGLALDLQRRPNCFSALAHDAKAQTPGAARQMIRVEATPVVGYRQLDYGRVRLFLTRRKRWYEL